MRHREIVDLAAQKFSKGTPEARSERDAMTEKFLYARKEAAHALGISVRSLDYLIAGKQLDTRRIGKKVLVTRVSLATFASGNHYGSISTAARKEASSKCA